MFDQKDLELLLEKMKRYRDGAWEMYEEQKELGPEWKEIAERNFGEATGFELAMIMVRKLLRGDDL